MAALPGSSTHCNARSQKQILGAGSRFEPELSLKPPGVDFDH